jgi:hypothetical protein
VPTDLDPRDLDEVRRRVVDPVVKSLIRPDELEAVRVEIEAQRVRVPIPPFRTEVERCLRVAIRACGERIDVPWTWTVNADYLWDAEVFAAEFYESLRDELVESRLSWGQWRDGEYRVPGPRPS